MFRNLMKCIKTPSVSAQIYGFSGGVFSLSILKNKHDGTGETGLLESEFTPAVATRVGGRSIPAPGSPTVAIIENRNKSSITAAGPTMTKHNDYSHYFIQLDTH